MYSGTLEDGLLQGQGREYDEDGLLIYEGNFVDGVRSGDGSCYEGGVLVYEGEFANGLYEGMGSLYEDGALAYRGNFAAGLQEGDVIVSMNGEEILTVDAYTQMLLELQPEQTVAIKILRQNGQDYVEWECSAVVGVLK